MPKLEELYKELDEYKDAGRLLGHKTSTRLWDSVIPNLPGSKWNVVAFEYGGDIRMNTPLGDIFTQEEIHLLFLFWKGHVEKAVYNGFMFRKTLDGVDIDILDFGLSLRGTPEKVLGVLKKYGAIVSFSNLLGETKEIVEVVETISLVDYLEEIKDSL